MHKCLSVLKCLHINLTISFDIYITKPKQIFFYVEIINLFL